MSRLIPGQTKLIKVNSRGSNHPGYYICITVKQRESKYWWMAVLMISSQLLLTGFVTYWLISQYQEERMNLHAELKHEYMSIHEQLVDSMLMQNLIAPSLHDSLMIKVDISDQGRLEILNDSVSSTVIMKHFTMDTIPDQEIFALHQGDSIKHDEMLVRSVKLFISQTDEAFRNDPAMHVFSMHIDSVAFLHLLKERFKEQDWKFGLERLNRGIPVTEPGSVQGLLLQNYHARETPEILVQGYAGYLIRSLIPQILFALILLGLSASSLLFAYRSLKKQVVLNKLRDDFIGNISHELKTPVSTVKVALEALNTYDLKKDPKVAGEYLDIASREVDRLEGLVDKVLHHAVLEDQSAMLQKVNCDLQDMVQKVIETLDIFIRERGAEVRVHTSGGPFRVLVDPVYMEGVIINLIDNSLKYAGPSPEIRIHLISNQTGIQLSVQDNGPGIPEEYHHQIFQKFFRVPAGDRHDVKGYGLGLSFASQVMAHHGGYISMRNLPDGGCKFTLQLAKSEE